MDLSEEEYLFLRAVLLMTRPLKNLIPQTKYPPHLIAKFGCRLFCLLSLIIASKKFITLSNNMGTELLARVHDKNQRCLFYELFSTSCCYSQVRLYLNMLVKTKSPTLSFFRSLLVLRLSILGTRAHRAALHATDFIFLFALL